MLAILNIQAILKFYQDHKEFIDNLISGGLPAIIPVFIGFFWWLKWRHRQRLIPPSNFPFEVIKPQNKDLKKQILGGEDDDPLADRNISYQQRVPNRNIRRELQEQIEHDYWVLILGRTGVGKTREAVELASYYNQLGWTVLYLKPGEWLDVPARMPKEIGTERKVLFFLDDLNRKMHRSRQEISPEAEKSPVERFYVPLQERLLAALEKYELLCGKPEIRVIATARNEKESQLPGEPSPWQQLQWEKYPALWGRFRRYELPEPDNDAIIGVFAQTISETKIPAEPEQYPALARSNDATFRNVIENLRRLRSDQLPLNVNTYQPSLGKTWEKRYKEALNRYPASRYVYDAVDLLQQFDISLEKFVVEPTALLFVRGNLWQQLKCRWQIRSALNYLIEVERILKPRDGQIEAKSKQVEAGEYIRPLLGLIFQLTDKHREQMQNSLVNFGWRLSNLERNKEALECYERAIEIKPNYDLAWNNKGIALFKLGRYEEALIAYDQAIEIKPNYDAAWYNKGIALSDLGRYEEALIAYDQAIAIKPNLDAAWYNKGIALSDLGRYEEALIAYDQAIAIKPNKDEAWYNKGIALSDLGRYEEALIAYDQAIAIKPNYDAAWNNKGIALFKLGRYEEALIAYDQAIAIKPNYDAAWYNKGIALSDLGRYEEALIAFDQAIAIKPNKDEAWYNKACCYAKQDNVDLALENLRQAIDLNPKYLNMAKTDSDFEGIRTDERFQSLIAEK